MNSVNFLEGINTDPSRMQTIMPFSTVGDFENYLQRLIKLPTQVNTAVSPVIVGKSGKEEEEGDRWKQ